MTKNWLIDRFVYHFRLYRCSPLHCFVLRIQRQALNFNHQSGCVQFPAESAFVHATLTNPLPP